MGGRVGLLDRDGEVRKEGPGMYVLLRRASPSPTPVRWTRTHDQDPRRRTDSGLGDTLGPFTEWERPGDRGVPRGPRKEEPTRPSDSCRVRTLRTERRGEQCSRGPMYEMGLHPRDYPKIRSSLRRPLSKPRNSR